MQRRLSALSVAFALVACRSSSTGDRSSPDASSSIPDAASPSTCVAIEAWAQACGRASACASSIVSACGRYDTAFGDGAKQALATCYANAASSCAADAAATSDVPTCFSDELSRVTPTDAQSKLASDYCATCASADATCATTFYSSNGPGTTYLGFSDTLVARIDARCTANALARGDAGGCANAFSACAFGVYGSEVPPLGCGSDGGP